MQQKCDFYKHGRRLIKRCFTQPTTTTAKTSTSTSTSTATTIPSLTSLGLSNWWKFDNTLQDSVTGLYLSSAFTNVWVADHLGKSNSAIYLNSGKYLTAPSAVYFSGDFTIASWVYVVAVTNQARLLTFEYTTNINTVTLLLSHYSTGYPDLYVTSNGGDLQANTTLPVGSWVHFAATLSGTVGTIYINGENAGSSTYASYGGVTRNQCWIGWSNWGEFINAYIDDLKFFNKGLTKSQIGILKAYY